MSNKAKINQQKEVEQLLTNIFTPPPATADSWRDKPKEVAKRLFDTSDWEGVKQQEPQLAAQMESGFDQVLMHDPLEFNAWVERLIAQTPQHLEGVEKMPPVEAIQQLNEMKRVIQFCLTPRINRHPSEQVHPGVLAYIEKRKETLLDYLTWVNEVKTKLETPVDDIIPDFSEYLKPLVQEVLLSYLKVNYTNTKPKHIVPFLYALELEDCLTIKVRQAGLVNVLYQSLTKLLGSIGTDKPFYRQIAEFDPKPMTKQGQLPQDRKDKIDQQRLKIQKVLLRAKTKKSAGQGANS